MTNQIEELRELIALMREFKVVKLDTGAATIELHESAFAASEPASAAADASPVKPLVETEELCACGCEKESDHSPGGCLRGCSPLICTAKPDQPPME